MLTPVVLRIADTCTNERADDNGSETTVDVAASPSGDDIPVASVSSSHLSVSASATGVVV